MLQYNKNDEIEFIDTEVAPVNNKVVDVIGIGVSALEGNYDMKLLEKS